MGNDMTCMMQADYDRLQSAIRQQVERIARKGFVPQPDNATPKGWYRRFRRLLMANMSK